MCKKPRSQMMAWCLRLSACWVCLSASPAIATDLVVIERAAFVEALSRADYLAQDRDNLTRQIDAALKMSAARLEQIQALQREIEALDAQIEDEHQKEAVLSAERERLQRAVTQQDFWGTMKNYGLVGLSAMVAVLVIL